MRKKVKKIKVMDFLVECLDAVIERNRVSRTKGKVPEYEQEDIERLTQNGESVRSIGRKLRRSQSTIHKYVKDKSKRNHVPVQEDIEEL